MSPEVSAHGPRSRPAFSVTAPPGVARDEVRRCRARPGAALAVEGLPLGVVVGRGGALSRQPDRSPPSFHYAWDSHSLIVRCLRSSTPGGFLTVALVGRARLRSSVLGLLAATQHPGATHKHPGSVRF